MLFESYILCLLMQCTVLQEFDTEEDGQKNGNVSSTTTENANNSIGDDALLIENKGMWYVRDDRNKTLDKLIMRGDGRGGTRTYNVRGISKRWYMFCSPPAEYIAYHTSLPINFEFKRFKFRDDSVYMLCPSEFGYREIVAHSISKSGQYILVKNTEGRWYRLRNSSTMPSELSAAVLSLPNLQIQSHNSRSRKQTHNHFLVHDAGVWYIRNRTLLEKIVGQGDGRGWNELVYGLGETGKWYTFEDPPQAFCNYLSKCPVSYDDNQLDRLGELIELETRTEATSGGRCYHDRQLVRTGTIWYAINELANGTLDRLILRGEDGYGKMIVRGTSRRWYRFNNMSYMFQIYTEQLPQKGHMFSIVKDARGSLFAINNKGFVHRVIKQDDEDRPYTLDFTPTTLNDDDRCL